MLWYKTLRQPFFKPNDALIPAAWFFIEACLVRSAYRLVQARPSVERRRALGLLGWNVFMIGGWSRLFFGRRKLAVSTVAAASMIATGAAFVHEATTKRHALACRWSLRCHSPPCSRRRFGP